MIKVVNSGRFGNIYFIYYFSLFFLKKIGMLNEEIMNKLIFSDTHSFNEKDGRNIQYENYIANNRKFFKNIDYNFQKISNDRNTYKSAVGTIYINADVIEALFNSELNEAYKKIINYYIECNDLLMLARFPNEQFIIKNYDTIYDSQIASKLFANKDVILDALDKKKFFDPNILLTSYIGLSIRHGDKKDKIDINKINECLTKYQDKILCIFSDNIQYVESLILPNIKFNNIKIYNKDNDEPDYVGFIHLSLCDQIINWKDTISSFIVAAHMQHDTLKNVFPDLFEYNHNFQKTV